ncbi:MAG: APC family permease [Myxococcales bacterium]|nr:APC family permease [Myxococcales bacterium]
MPRPRQLGVVPLVASTFFMVSGGAYGLEELVACGYGVALVTLLVTPLLWSLPTALLVGELASALPHQGGYYAWVRRALGPFWGFQEAWLSLVASVFDMAIYPTLFTLYLGRVMPALSSGIPAVIVGAGIIAGCAVWNLRGAVTVGHGSVALGLAVLAPFAAFAIAAVVHRIAGPALATAAAAASPAAPDLLGGLLVAMWNYMGWDNASTIAEEVSDPARTYPRAVFGAVSLVAAAYVLPVAAAAVAGIDPASWTTGAWVDASRQVGGRTLALAVVAGATVCGVGMFNALLLSYSRLPPVLADDGFLPRWLARRDPSSGAPRASIIVCSVAYAACLGLGFRRLVVLDILLYGSSLVLEFATLVVLRRREPELPRPFRIPGGSAVAGALALGPIALLVIAFVHSGEETVGRMSSLSLGALLVAAGPLLYAVRRKG